jgi:hypothetical protein
MDRSIVLVPIAFFAFLAIVLVVPAWLRHRARVMALRMMCDAMANGRATDAAVIEKLLLPPPRAVGKGFALINLVLGVSAFCIGVALALAVRILGDDASSDPAGMMVGSLVNVCVGVGLIALAAVSLRLFSGIRRPARRWDYASVLALITLFLGTSSIAIASGLALAAHFYVGPASGDRAAAGMFVGALVNACSGIGFIALGVFILRVFADHRGE